MAPVSGEVRDTGCGPGGGGACCNTSEPWPGRPVPGRLGFMTETTGKTCLPCCCAWMPVPRPLTWRPGRWRVSRARPAGLPRGDTAGNGRSGCAAGGAAGPAAAPASCCRPGARRAARTASRSSAPRRAWRWPGPATGPSPPCSASRPPPPAAGRRLRARAGQLRAHAIGELNVLGFYPPGPPCEPAGSPLGDPLNALAAAVDCTLRARAEDNLAAGRPARPGPLPHARPGQQITCRRSRAPPCPQPGRRRSLRPAAPRAATP
jgi:hypothetical protein